MPGGPAPVAHFIEDHEAPEGCPTVRQPAAARRRPSISGSLSFERAVLHLLVKAGLYCLWRPRTRCYRDGVLVDEDFPLAAVSEHLEEPNSLVWVHLRAPDTKELALLAGELGLHALAVEDATNPRERPKLDRYSDHSFLSAYSAHFDPGTVELKTAEIAAFLTSQALITVCKDEAFEVAPVLARWDASPDLAKHGVAFLVHGLLDHLVDGYFEAVQSLDDEIEELEDLMSTR